MGLDAFATTHPIVQTIRTVEDTNQAFDAITYQKGEAEITMLESYAGEDVWRQGLRSNMEQHKYANTRTERKSVGQGKSVSVSVDNGCRRIIHKKKTRKTNNKKNTKKKKTRN